MTGRKALQETRGLIGQVLLDKAAEDEEGKYGQTPLRNDQAAARYMDEGLLRWLFLIHIKSGDWETTACRNQVPHLDTRGQAEEPMVDTTARPTHSPPPIFAAHIRPHEWYPQKIMNQLWMRCMGRGFNTISSILSPCFIDLELLYTNPPAF